MIQATSLVQENSKPAFGTLEWAPYSVNFVNGCSNNCLYCYSKEMAIRFGRKTPSNWHIEEVNYKKLQHHRRYDGRIMFPTSHDITPVNLDNAIILMKSLLEVGNELLVVSKPHELCIRQICSLLSPFRHKIVFRFTIGSPRDSVLTFWEPNAPNFEERIRCLRMASESDYKTSISIEPMLDSIDHISLLIDKLLPYVSDAIWVGKPNFLMRRLKMNGALTQQVYQRAEELETFMADKCIKTLFDRYCTNPKVKWKDSIKTVLGLYRPLSPGQDI